MGIIENIGLGVLGFFIGNFLFARGVTTAWAIWEIAKNASFRPGAKIGQIAMIALCSDAVWIAVSVGFLAYYLHSAAWFGAVTWGALVAITFFSLIAVWIARKSRDGERKKNAA